MRYFVISVFVVLSSLGVLAFPASAQMALSVGPQEHSGVVVNGELGLALLMNAGSMSEGMLPLQGQTVEIAAELKKLFVEQREYPDLYSDVPEVKLHGDLQIVNKRYLFTVDRIVTAAESAPHAAQVAALEQLAKGVKALADAGGTAEARAIAQAALPAATKLAALAAGTPLTPRATAVVQQLKFLLSDAPSF